MTVLDSFIAFARTLPAGQREGMDESLTALMDSYSERFAFTPEEMADLRARADEIDPEYSDPDDIERLFGRPFRN